MRCGGDWWGGVLLAVCQREVAPLGLAESGVFPFGVDLPQDRSVERRVGRCPIGRRPKTRDLHRLDHRFAIHRVLRFAKYDDRGFDLANLFGGRLPANLFYGTGIPACIVVIDKEYAQARKVIFMIDASAGYMKDGAKNRLRDQDIQKIVDVFNKQTELPRYSRLVPLEEIEKNDFNLNLPRYIDSQQAENLQDIAGHLQGGIPEADVQALDRYWAVCPKLQQSLFKKNRKGYLDLKVDKADIKKTIYEHPEFKAVIDGMNNHFAAWREKTSKTLKALKPGFHPKQMIAKLSESLLDHYRPNDGSAILHSQLSILNSYDIYQHLMDYWTARMQDDCYAIWPTAP